MPYVKLEVASPYKGRDHAKGAVLEVSEGLLNHMILNGSGKRSDKKSHQEYLKSITIPSFETMNEEDLKSFKFSSVRKEVLEAYANALGIDEKLIEEASTMEVLKEHIKTKIEDSE